MKRLSPAFVIAVALAASAIHSALGQAELPAGADSPAHLFVRSGYPGHFLTVAKFDLATLLPPPPTPSSLAAAADIETVLQVQATRTAVEVTFAKVIDDNVVFNNAIVLGPWFSQKNLPYLTKFIAAVGSDATAVGSNLRKFYGRRRPMLVDNRVHPCVRPTVTPCYPSGHTTQAFIWADVLAQIFPEKADELMALAHRAAWARVTGGVHFPTDIVAGRMLADWLIAEFLKNPQFREAVAKARAEAEPFLQKKAA